MTLQGGLVTAVSHMHPLRLPSVMAIIAASAAVFVLIAGTRLNHDSAWLIDATRRWLEGQRLYADIIEVNPPLIFYDMLLLTAGMAAKTAYFAGVCIAIGLTALWTLRLQGKLAAVAAFVACVLAGLQDFGQRDHLALIFVIPLLLGLSVAGRRERIALAIFAFLGIGLKPVFLIIPVAAVVADAVLARSARRLIPAEMVTLGMLGAVYVGLVALLHPHYFSDIVPLGRFVYWAFESELSGFYLATSLLGGIALALPFLLRDRRAIPVASAGLAALASFFLQGSYWGYHLVPAIGLAIFVSIWARGDRRSRWLMAAVLSLGQLLRGPYIGTPPIPIPEGTKARQFSARMSASPIPTYWIVMSGTQAAIRRSGRCREPGAYCRTTAVPKRTGDVRGGYFARNACAFAKTLSMAGRS